MPWREMSIMSGRQEFVSLAGTGGVSFSALCKRFGISRKTGYKWLARHRKGPDLQDRSRRPHSSPEQTSASIEAQVLKARTQHPVWGGRKLAAWLKGHGVKEIPSPSTITEILRRHGLIDPAASRAATPFIRFEREAPNDLWQMDFKGHVPMVRGGRCHPLSVLDDHSRFSIGLRACDNERDETVRGHLIEMFRLYGLPERMLCDNGSPWGTAGGDAEHTGLTVWLLRLGVRVSHGRPMHPQTQGKLERFNRTLKAELLSRLDLLDLIHGQAEMDPWRQGYNFERPHEAVDDKPPATRYQPSHRIYPEELAELEYGPQDEVRRVGPGGIVSYKGIQVRVGRAFIGERLGIGPTSRDGVMRVRLGAHPIGDLDLNVQPLLPRRRASLATLAPPADAGETSVTHVSEQV